MIAVGALVERAQASGSRGALESAVDAVRQLRAWCDAHEIRIFQELESLTFGAPETIAAAGCMSQRDGDLVAKRARTVEQIPALAAALGAGRVSGRHVDVTGRVLRSLEPTLRPAFCTRVTGLIDIAETSTPDEWARRLRRETRALRTDGGMPRLEQQRRNNTRLRTWVDPETGMWHLAGAFDPVTGTELDHMLRNAVTRLFTDSVPPTAPDDPLQRQDHLRALALVDLLTNPSAAGGGRMQASVAIDLRQLDNGEPLVDFGIPVDIPYTVVRDLLDDADITPVVIRDGVIVWAPGDLNLGRNNRLANKHQRRALRARYPKCVVQGCDVHYLNTKLHHLTWWEHGGLTDLINLAPVCTRHHTQIHNGELTLTRNPDWTFTTSYRTQRPPGPPRAA